jgi:hypothetical protein
MNISVMKMPNIPQTPKRITIINRAGYYEARCNDVRVFARDHGEALRRARYFCEKPRPKR